MDNNNIFEEYLSLKPDTPEYIKANEAIIEKYPFLSLEWGEDNDKAPNETPDCRYTWLDDFPIGWRKAFAFQMMDEVKAELERNGDMDSFQIMQIKEKYGELRFYYVGTTEGSLLHDIVHKYSVISRHVCIKCGNPNARMVYAGWISPYCRECWDMIATRMSEQYKQKHCYENVTKDSDNDQPKEAVYFRCSPDGESERHAIDLANEWEKINKTWTASLNYEKKGGG